MKKFELIVLDMDGVISNFNKGVFDYFDIEWTEENKRIWNWCESILGLTDEEFWNIIRGLDDFWLNLEPFPWNEELLKITCIYAKSVIISSKSPDDIKCYTQKRKWLDEHGFDKYEHFIGSGSKGWMAKANRVLIDDFVDNVVDFVGYGGKAIIFPQEYNIKYLNIEKVPENRVRYVEGMLNKIKGE